MADPVGAGSYFNVELLDIGADGTLWTYLEVEVGDPGPREVYLARLGDGRWTVYSEADGVLKADSRGEFQGHLRVGPDGTVWITQYPDGSHPGLVCRGLRSFDGTTWRRYLDGRCVWDLDVAPDGSVWVIEGLLGKSSSPHWVGDTFVIRPESAAATGSATMSP